MNYAIRYYTKSGNTEKLAKAVAEAVTVPALSIDSPLEEKVDVLFLGCSYYAFDMDARVKAFLVDNQDKIGSIALFGTSAMMKSMKKPMQKALEGLNITLLGEEYHCHGSFGVMHKGKPDEDDMKAVKKFAAKVMAN